jgi:hypothetical protein
VGIVQDLAPLFDAEIVAQIGVLSGDGTWTASGVNQILPCRYEGGPRLIRGAASAQEVTSSLLCIVGGVLMSHDVSLMRFDVPATFYPQTTEIQALRIDPIIDETGVIGGEVYLP